MTALAGLLILAAVLIAAALAVLGTIAAAAKLFPPRLEWANEAASAKVAGSRARVLRAGRSHRARAPDRRSAPGCQNRMPTRIGMKSQ
jgi:hypothetical protein